MLQFFRKYQSYFFAITTFVIVISFSFFGTFNALPNNPNRDLIAFTAVDGTQVPRSELDEMATFLSTDNEDKRLFGGVWGPNFLNDGYIKHDLLETGLAEILVTAYPNLVAHDLQQRLEKEKRYSLYIHPQAKFLSTEAAWAYFAPSMKKQFQTLQQSEDAVAQEAFGARTALFLDEKKFPAPMLRQVLRYQQKQYSWLTPDPNLDHGDLSLFGYHTLDDWFGPRFLRLMAEFTINASKIAEQKGYEVSKAEALADLMRNADISFQQNLNNPYLGVANSLEYFNEQLRHLGMDQNMAAKVWRQVLLCRRMFQDIGNAVITDPLGHQNFFAFAQETVAGDLYRLPPELRLGDYRSLQKFEIYLDAIATRNKDNKSNDTDFLALPKEFLDIDKIKKKTPELIQKRYLLQVAQVNKKSLQTKVGVKEMWNWEVSDENWEHLKTEFPELGLKKDASREERFAILDGLDNNTRAKVDQIARSGVVDMHPQWMQQALQEAEPKQMLVGLSPTGGSSFVVGLENRKELMRLLDEAPLASEERPQPSAQEVPDILSSFTADKNTFYRVKVIERAPQEEIMTFAEANKEGALDQLLDRKLEEYYVKNRKKFFKKFLDEDETWKPFADAKVAVTEHYFETLLKRIRQDYTKANPNKGQPSTTGDWAASARLYSHARDFLARLEKNDPNAQAMILSSEDKKSENEKLSLGAPFKNQWKWEKESFQANRGTTTDLNKEELLALATDAWTGIYAPANGDISFFQLKQRDKGGDVTAVYDSYHEANRQLSDDAQRTFIHTVVHNLQEKKAISLEYLDRQVESIEPAQPIEIPSL